MLIPLKFVGLFVFWSSSVSIAERSYPTSEVGSAAERSYPTYKERQLHGRKRTKRSYFMFKVRRGSREEIPLVQGKRNPSKTVGVMRGHQRAHTLKA